VGQIEVVAPSAAVTIAASSLQTITLSPAASFSGIGIKYTGTTGSNLTIASLLALGSSQTWSVASNRTLTVSGVVSGATSSLTKSDAGTLAFTTATNTFGSGGGQTFTVSAGLVTTTVAGSLGSASNAVVVSSGGALRLGAVPSQTSFSVIGSGNALQPAAIFFNSSTPGFALGKTLAISGNAPTIGLNPNNPHAGVISGTPTGDVTLLLSGDVGLAGATLSSTQNFTVASGSYLVLKGMTAAGVPAAGEFNFSTTDAGPFGATGNEVKVQSTVGLTNFGAPGAITLSRNYFFDGETSSAAPAGSNTYSVYPFSPNTGTFVFQGTVKATAGNWVKTNSNGAAGATVVQFGSAMGGKLDGSGGAWNIRSFDSDQTIRIHQNLDVSDWGSGAIRANKVEYGRAITGAATYDTTAVIDNISGAALTLTHSGYTLLGNLTFTGSANMSLGSGNVATGAGLTLTVSASTLTVPGTITGSGFFSKAGIGGLTFDGATSGYSNYSHTGGTLTLNNSNSLGTSTAPLTITAAAANTLDSTTGATLLNTGATNLQGNFTWGGSADLTLGSGAVTLNAARTITFVAGKTGMLKAPGAITTISNLALTIGGSPVGGSRSRFWLVGANALISATHSVTAGYFRASNAGGFGNASTVMWTVSSNAALEVDGSISPTSARNCTITGPGPNLDGALRSVSGTNVWNGAIIPPVQSLASPTRIQVDAGTFTLAAGTYATIAPTVSGTPLQFTALGASAVLNQPRQLTAAVSDVTVNNGGVGTVVFSVANSHTGGFTVEGGTAKVTNATATSTGTVQVNATATLESTVQSIFTTLRLGTNGSGSRAVLKFAA
jgi:autotransporter-associated beta strand protein